MKKCADVVVAAPSPISPLKTTLGLLLIHFMPSAQCRGPEISRIPHPPTFACDPYNNTPVIRTGPQTVVQNHHCACVKQVYVFPFLIPVVVVPTWSGVVYICVSCTNASFPTRPFLLFSALPLCLFFMVRRILDSFIQICIKSLQMMCQQLNITVLICSYQCAEVWELKRVKV